MQFQSDQLLIAKVPSFLWICLVTAKTLWAIGSDLKRKCFETIVTLVCQLQGSFKFLPPISLYPDPSSPTILLVYEIYENKTWIPRRITKNTLILLYYGSSQILYLSYSTTPCLFYPLQFNTQEYCIPVFLLYQDVDTIWNKKKPKSFSFWTIVKISNLLCHCKNKL